MRTAFLACVLLLAGCAAPGPSQDEETSPSTTPTSGSATTPPRGTTPPPTQGGQPPSFPTSRFAGCSGEGRVTFVNAPMRAEDYAMILPYGLMVGGHVTPIDHMYFAPPHGSARDAFEVRAVADGVIYSMQPRDINVESGTARPREWRMDIAHTCTFTSYFDLLTSLDPALEAEYDRTQGGRTAAWQGIPVKAGQLVGRIGAQTLDFGVYDYEVTLPGFIVPAHYDREPWKVHTVDPYPHFPEAIREEMLAKALRKVEPRAGKIDWDEPGKAVGNWFLEGTNGYAGADPARYWTGHLALAYDAYDPTRLRFSIGTWTPGKEAQLGVLGNAPDWRTVTPESGVVKVELVYEMHYARNAPERRGFGPGGVIPGDDVTSERMGPVQGVALLQLIDADNLKLEVFPGKTAAEVAGFTSAARTYVR